MMNPTLYARPLAWALIAALASQAAVAPAAARDSDIYLTTTTGTTTAEPNVLFVMGTNDRMNIAEPWREYDPNTYDSHVEYLWNDINIISNTEVTAESGTAISDVTAPVSPFSPWGTWAGSTTADRRSLWQAVKLYANATDTLDASIAGTAPRYVFRNYYNDSTWLYWLPTGTAMTDPRLRSPSFNRFRAGPNNYVSSTRGGVVFPPTGPTSPYNYASVYNTYAQYDLCASAPAALTPSTVMSPSSVSRNAGYILNQQWIRWENHLGLATVGNAGYPGSSTNVNGYAVGYMDTQPGNQPPVNGYTVPPVSPASIAGAPYRDNVGSSPVGSQGAPIREQRQTVTSPTVAPDGLRSYAGWTDVAADLGGYTYQSAVINFPYTYSAAGANDGSYGVLQATLGAYGITSNISTWYFTAWKGNRDATPAFGSSTGLSGYYDFTAACNNSTGPTSSGTCTQLSFGGTSAQNATWTLNCKYNPGYTEYDANNTIRTSGGACSNSGAAACSDPRTSAPNNCSDFSAPVNCVTTPVAQTTFYSKVLAANCGASGQTTVTVGNCAWSGRNSGVAPGTPGATTSPLLIEGQGVYWYGGTCQETGGGTASTSACVVSGTSPRTLNGVSRPDVTGPYSLATYASYANTGCGNAIAAGTYKYGGTCSGGTKYTVSTTAARTTAPTAPTTTRSTTSPLTTCAFSGGSSLNIRGTSQTYNQTCASSEATTDQTCLSRYGTTCDNSSSAAANQINTAVCPSAQTSKIAIAATSSTAYYFQAYARAGTTVNNYYHECISDGAAGLNPSGSYPTAYMRSFATAANTTVATNATTYAGTNLTAAYVSTAAPTAQRYVADSSKNIDVYSVNYLNWKFGAKACRGTDGNLITSSTIPSTATCSPIGRKTRLQVAQDALSGLVTNTNSIRLGLEVYNKTGTCLAVSGTAVAGGSIFTAQTNPGFVNGNAVTLSGDTTGSPTISTIASDPDPTVSTQYFTLSSAVSGTLTTTGTIAAADSVLTVASNPGSGFKVGGTIVVAGAGAAGADLTATILSVDGGGLTLTLNTTAGTAVSGAAVKGVLNVTVTANPCSGAVSDEGGNIAYAVKRMGNDSTDTDYANRATLIAKINSVTAQSRTPLTEVMYEAYRYFSGRTPKFGTLTTAASSGTVADTRDTSAVCTGISSACPYGAGYYASPMMNNPSAGSPANCQKNYIVMLTNGQPEDDSSANGDIKNMRWFDSALNTTVAPRTDIDTNGVHNAAYHQFTSVAGGQPYGPTDLAGTGSDGGYIWLDELTYFMDNADMSPGAANFFAEGSSDKISGVQNIKTFTIGFAGVDAPVIQNAADVAGGQYKVATNADDLSAALTSIFDAIRDWTPTAASATVPISSLNRGENSNDIYLAFFGPSINNVWHGTVKKYQLGQGIAICGGTDDKGICLTGQTVLNDGNYNIQVLPADAASSSDTEVDSATVSGPNDPPPGPFAHGAWQPTTEQDGSQANRGGTGYVLINTTALVPTPDTPDTRHVYTYLTNSVLLQDGTSSTLDLSDTTNRVHPTNTAIDYCRLGNVAACSGTATMTPATRDSLINFILGGSASDPLCVDGITDSSSKCTTWSSNWPHSDVQHSKPAVVTYDTTQNPPIQYLFYVQNNGMLTAVNTHTGQEKWSFLIEEALPQLSSLLNPVAGQEIYVADGSPSVFFDDQNGDGIVNGSDRVWVFFGLRRGGRVYYALDITDINHPRFMWKISARGGTGRVCVASGTCTSAPAYNRLGQTWSAPTVVKLKALGLTTPALIFGGGYDTQEDALYYVADGTTHADTTGNQLYVVNATDPTSPLQQWGYGASGTFGGTPDAMNYAIPSDVTALNSDNDGQNYVDRIYVGDLGGNVWRFDVDSASPAAWRAWQLARLSDSTGEKRKFYFPPAVAPQAQPIRFDAVYIGSGDKEHPTYQTNPVAPAAANPKVAADKMFMLMDTSDLTSSGQTAGALNYPIVFGSSLLLDATTTGTTGLATSALSGKQGWYFSLDNGEKVINSPTIFDQALRFGTYAPIGRNDACTPPGQGRLNEINAVSGALFSSITDAQGNPSRYYTDFLTRGYISTGQLIVLGKNVYHIVVSDGQLKYKLVATIGNATKIYWYMEPEE